MGWTSTVSSSSFDEDDDFQVSYGGVMEIVDPRSRLLWSDRIKELVAMERARFISERSASCT